MDRTYYKTDSLKISYREYWHFSQGRVYRALYSWTKKLLGIRMKLATLISDTPFREMIVDAAQVPEEAWASIKPLVDECVALGFGEPIWSMLPERQSQIAESATATMLHLNRETVARIIYIRTVPSIVAATERIITAFLTPVSDGTYLATSNNPPTFDVPPKARREALPGASFQTVWERHSERIQMLSRKRLSLAPLTTDDAAMRFYEFVKSGGHDDKVKRGVYVPMTPEEVAQERLARETLESECAEISPDNLAAFRAIRQLEAQNSAGKDFFFGLLLLVSLVVFVFVARWHNSFGTIGLLLLVLFIHEVGHYLAMRIFKYPGAQMYFIPFHGAAVSGSNITVKGYKKVIVSLMGPLPGILIGTGVAIYAIQTDNISLVRLALFFLIPNAFDFLPFLPLDGGWVVSGLLTSRNLWAESVFRVFAAVGLVMVGFALHMHLVAYLAVPLLLNVGRSIQLAAVTGELRQIIPLVRDGQETMQASVADTILSEVRAEIPSLKSPLQVAQTARSVYRSLATRPPGFLASLGLATVYIATVALAVLTISLAVSYKKEEQRSEAMRAALRELTAASDRKQEDLPRLVLAKPPADR